MKRYVSLLALAAMLALGGGSTLSAQPGYYGSPGNEPLMRDPAPNPVLGYFRDRALDFVDMFRLKLHVGSIGAAARVTTLVQLGAVYTDGPTIGLDRRAFGSWYEYRLAAGISAAYSTEINTGYIWGNEFADPTSAYNTMEPRGLIRNGVFFDDGRDRYFSIGAEAHLGIGLDVGFYPEEMVDFLLGIFTIDILYDDLAWAAGDPFYTQPPPGTGLPPL